MFIFSLEIGCNKTTGTKLDIRATSPGTAADDALDSAKDTLRKEVGLKACRNAIQKINGFFSRNPDQKPKPLTDAQREFLVNQVCLEEEELAEVNSTTFTLLDAHYLDLCFLLRDAVRSFGVGDRPALERVEIAFDWVMRQVRLQERDGPANPPHLVLRRGWGTSLERAFVFLALAQQQEIDGCIITYPSQRQGQSHSRFWVAGVLVDKKVYLFDTRLGIPLPSPQGRGMATLAEVLSHPDPFHALKIDDTHQYDMTPVLAKMAEIHPAFSLSSLAPRMKYLEGLLAANNKVKVASDASALLKKFQDAVTDLGAPVPVAGKFGDPATPLRLFREFLPPAEGGIDKFQRKLAFDIELVPWAEAFNPYFSDFPENLKLGNDLRVAFQKLFVEFPLPPLRQQGIISVENILQGKDQEEKQKDEMILRIIQSFLPLVTQRVESVAGDHYLLAPRTPRDDLIRGRFDDATTKLVEVLD
ncbi:MAG TPA: hypothetical protein VGY77_06570, partial [Gemmataceae bacterium]|nr:hypothetical protein [Gemmataceae bacterium]